MADYSNGANSVPYGSMDRGSGGGLAYPPPVNHDPFNVPPVKPPYEVNQRPSDGGGYGNSNASAVNPYGGLPSYEDRGRYGGNFGNFGKFSF